MLKIETPAIAGLRKPAIGPVWGLGWRQYTYLQRKCKLHPLYSSGRLGDGHLATTFGIDGDEQDEEQ